MNRLLTTLLITAYACISQAQSPVAGMANTVNPAPAVQPTHTISAPADGSTAHKAVHEANKKAKQDGKLRDVPSGHSEKPITISFTAGRSLSTPSCGIITELTVMHRSHEPGMVAHILEAARTGAPLLFEGLKCHGIGKASAASVSIKPQPSAAMSQAERCALPSPTGKMSDC